MTRLLPPTPAVLRAYRASTYVAGGIEIRIGQRPPPIPARWAGRSLVLLSACNPGGRRRPDGWNRRRMMALRAALHRVSIAEGEGRLDTWSEPLLLAAMAPRRGIVLARRFGQNAIVVLPRDRAARLVLLQT